MDETLGSDRCDGCDRFFLKSLEKRERGIDCLHKAKAQTESVSEYISL